MKTTKGKKSGSKQGSEKKVREKRASGLAGYEMSDVLVLKQSENSPFKKGVANDIAQVFAKPISVEKALAKTQALFDSGKLVTVKRKAKATPEFVRLRLAFVMRELKMHRFLVSGESNGASETKTAAKAPKKRAASKKKEAAPAEAAAPAAE